MKHSEMRGCYQTPIKRKASYLRLLTILALTRVGKDNRIRCVMPFPLIPLAIGALVGASAKKPKKVKAVSGYKTKKGKKVKAYLKKAK